ncbi:5-formyltetrahydrofolate cyclo-ligase [PVC group bacterium (ex Bugula neritina AB1)]|nr:5-formyltetrahydrofolate cyclo-ligase [PVC group bacterium (ex Bugula neritina AB1)]
MKDLFYDKLRMREGISQKFPIASLKERQSEENLLSCRLLDTYLLSKKNVFLGYRALNDEVDLCLFYKKMIEKGQIVCFPKVEKHEMCFYRCFDYEDSCFWQKNLSYGMLEPFPDESRSIDPKQISVAMVPGRAFDQSNGRLGRGKGFYDKFFRKYPHIFKVGIGFSFQMIEKVPMSCDDQFMNRVEICL